MLRVFMMLIYICFYYISGTIFSDIEDLQGKLAKYNATLHCYASLPIKSPIKINYVIAQSTKYK